MDDFYKGRAHVLINPPGFTEYDDLNRYEYNVDTAKQLLADGGYNGETFKLLYNQTFPDAQAIMPLIQSDLQAAGLVVELVPTDNETYLAKYNDRTQWDGFIAVGGSEGLSPDRSAPVLQGRRPDLRVGLHEPADLRALGGGSLDGRPGRSRTSSTMSSPGSSTRTSRRRTSIRRTS